MTNTGHAWGTDLLVVPVGGVGQRFSDAGYSTPKPLIQVHGSTQIELSLSGVMSNIHFRKIIVACRSGIFDEIKNIFSKKNHPEYSSIEVIDIGEATSGAADTVQRALRYEGSPDSSFWVIDSDTFLQIQNFKLPMNSNSAAIGVGLSDNSAHSFVEVDDNDLIIDIAEKNKISSKAVAGLYGFISKNLFIQAVERVRTSSNNELYISTVIKNLLTDCHVEPIDVTEWVPIGTPEEINKLNPKQINLLSIHGFRK